MTYAQRLAGEAERAGVRLGEPRFDDDDWAAKLDLLADSPVALVSLTFGCPSAEDVARWKRSTGEVWVTVTSVDEARRAEEAGADCLVVQGSEAGGHRGGFTDDHDGVGLLALVQVVRTSTSVPLIATGGIMTGAGLAAILAAGALPAQWAPPFCAARRQGRHWRTRRRSRETIGPRRSPARSPDGSPGASGTAS